MGGVRAFVGFSASNYWFSKGPIGIPSLIRVGFKVKGRGVYVGFRFHMLCPRALNP